MNVSGKYTMLFIEGFFIKDLSCCTDSVEKRTEGKKNA